MSSFLPFLYQTRTLTRVVVRLPSPFPGARNFHTGRIIASRSRSSESSIPFEWDGSKSPSAADGSGAHKQEGSGIDGREVGGDEEEDSISTLTPTEQRAFEKIFGDIAKKSGQKASPLLPASDKNDDAINDPTPATPEWMARLPVSLRKDARSALGLSDASEPAVSSSETPGDLSEMLEDEDSVSEVDSGLQEARIAFRNEAYEKLDTLLSQCNTDREVWSVLEEQVFSMIEKMHITELRSKEANDAGKEARGSKPRIISTTKEYAKGDSPEIDINVHGPLYSMHLLQGLKTLDTQFQQPSPLVFQILHRVRELGVASYVLGASTPFYNELASITWRRLGDPRAVITLLEEMQQAGLEFDEQSLALVHEMESSLDAMSEGTMGPFSKALSHMPSYSVDVRAKLGGLANRIEPAVARAKAGQ